MPLVHSRLSQYAQFTWLTHLFLKVALDVDMVDLPTAGRPSIPARRRQASAPNPPIGRPNISLYLSSSRARLDSKSKKNVFVPPPFALLKRQNRRQLMLAKLTHSQWRRVRSNCLKSRKIPS